jgi:hypothetical protein
MGDKIATVFSHRLQKHWKLLGMDAPSLEEVDWLSKNRTAL